MSECSSCHGARGRICKADLLVRYGLDLETARSADWLCAHCNEEQNEDPWQSGTICNSSTCMAKRGLPCTGIAIAEARASGFGNVGAWLQAGVASPPTA